jgi:hypothetical protein
LSDPESEFDPPHAASAAVDVTTSVAIQNRRLASLIRKTSPVALSRDRSDCTDAGL